MTGIRLRSMLLLFGAVALVAVLRWKEDDGPVRPSIRTDSIARPVASRQIGTGSFGDSVYAQRAASLGVLVMLREYGNDTGSFYSVAPTDSARLLGELGFFPASRLLDSASYLEAIGDSAAPVRLTVSAFQVVDSALRDPGDGCILEIPVPTRRVSAPAIPWTIALAPGALHGIPSAEWNTSADSAADRALALQLATHLRPDSSAAALLPVDDATLRKVPFRFASIRRFTSDGTEFLIADVRREGEYRAGAVGAGTFLEQRVLIGERDPAIHDSEFRLAWHAYHIGDADEVTSFEPVQLMRLGPRRQLTLYLNADYGDGGGGVFITRTAPGVWTQIAQWYGGC